MKNLALILVLAFCFIGCNSTKTLDNEKEELASTAIDTVRIANEEVEYEIIIIEPGFTAWLETRAQPKGYYSQTFLETRNQLLVTEWNNRANQPGRYDTSLYEMRIDYDPFIDYGYEVNYILYNYFIYFQLRYKQQLSSFVPRI
ncbi:MAG: hypothetical protein HKO92_02075 [Flavobacteriaceae bacterium]|nr:hypothetical protein [Flavobacteriaceae bacterium]